MLRMNEIDIGPSHMPIDPKLFWARPNCFGQDQTFWTWFKMVKFSSERQLKRPKMIWTSPKLF